MEITANALQTVSANQNVLFAETPVCGKNCSIIHKEGSGIITLRGITNQCRARYKVNFGANIAIPTGGTVEAISIAISVEGEPIGYTTMTVTPAAVENFFNIHSAVYIDIPRGCCSQITVENLNDQAILVQNANLIVERIA